MFKCMTNVLVVAFIVILFYLQIQLDNLYQMCYTRRFSTHWDYSDFLSLNMLVVILNVFIFFHSLTIGDIKCPRT